MSLTRLRTVLPLRRLAGSPGLLGPLWLVVTGLGLTFGRSTIAR